MAWKIAPAAPAQHGNSMEASDYHRRGGWGLSDPLGGDLTRDDPWYGCDWGVGCLVNVDMCMTKPVRRLKEAKINYLLD